MPNQLQEVRLTSEQMLEDMIVASPLPQCRIMPWLL